MTQDTRWNREAAIEMIAEERIVILRKPEAERAPAEAERLSALNADMSALSPRVSHGMVDQHQSKETTL